MTEHSLVHVLAVQNVLAAADVLSVITGDIGFSFYGVDIVTHVSILQSFCHILGL